MCVCPPCLCLSVCTHSHTPLKLCGEYSYPTMLWSACPLKPPPPLAPVGSLQDGEAREASGPGESLARIFPVQTRPRPQNCLKTSCQLGHQSSSVGRGLVPTRAPRVTVAFIPQRGGVWAGRWELLLPQLTPHHHGTHGRGQGHCTQE